MPARPRRQPTQIQLHLTLDQLRQLGSAADAKRAWAADPGPPGRSPVTSPDAIKVLRSHGPPPAAAG